MMNHGMDFWGFVRTMWPTLFPCLMVFVFATVVLGMVMWYTRKKQENDFADDKSIARKVTLWIYAVLSVVLFVIIFMRAVELGLQNRTPRNAEDRDGIYKQMEERKNEK